MQMIRPKSSCDIRYQFAWTLRTRPAILTTKIAARLTDLLNKKVNDIGGKLLQTEIHPDHVRLLGVFTPSWSPTRIFYDLKDYTSLCLQQEFPEISISHPVLWANTFYVGTVGEFSMDIINNFIEANQRISVLHCHDEEVISG
jgi:REP element-mobilizing transposase RayT